LNILLIIRTSLPGVKNHLLGSTGSSSTLATGVSTGRKPTADFKTTTNATASTTTGSSSSLLSLASLWSSFRTSWEALSASLKPHL
jgi:hypothetical protein